MKIQLIIAVDGLNPRFLGPYGNNWVSTPFFDRLAASGVVYDQFWAESTEYGDNLIAMLTLQHPASSSTLRYPPKIQRLLLTDDPQGDLLQDHFDEVQVVETSESDSQRYEALLGAGIEQVFAWSKRSTGQQKCQIWICTRGLFSPWCAPVEYQKRFKDETDPDPILLDSVPTLKLEPGYDPDERLAYLHAYAAEISYLDEQLDEFWQVIDESKLPCDWVIAGIRGFALGEHLVIGSADETLFSEKLHLPLITTTSGGLPNRHPSLLGTHQFQSCLRESSHSQDDPGIVVSAANGCTRIQTTAWAYIYSLEQKSPQLNRLLFAKPDDPLEINEASGVCPEIAECLHKELQRQMEALQNGQGIQKPDLPVQAYNR